MTQKEMAGLGGRSPVTIQKVELNLLPLGDELAMEIQGQTGVDLAWLKSNDVSQPIVNRWGTPYSSADFENAQSKLGTKWGKGKWDWVAVNVHLWNHLSSYCSIAASAMEKGSFNLFSYKMGCALDELRKQFGCVGMPFRGLGTGIPVEKVPVHYRRQITTAIEKLFAVADKVAPAPTVSKPPASAQPSRPVRRRRA
jgi:hypothetical protein